MYGVRAHEFYCTPLLCKIIGSTTNSAKCGKTPVNGAKSPGMAWNPREMQMNSGNSRAYFASYFLFQPSPSCLCPHSWIDRWKLAEWKLHISLRQNTCTKPIWKCEILKTRTFDQLNKFRQLSKNGNLQILFTMTIQNILVSWWKLRKKFAGT